MPAAKPVERGRNDERRIQPVVPRPVRRRQVELELKQDHVEAHSIRPNSGTDEKQRGNSTGAQTGGLARPHRDAFPSRSRPPRGGRRCR